MRPPIKRESRRAAGSSVETGLQASHKHTTDDDPLASRRRFLVVALMAGWLRPERVAKSIAAELEAQSTQ
jgi:hypothetical protein